MVGAGFRAPVKLQGRMTMLSEFRFTTLAIALIIVSAAAVGAQDGAGIYPRAELDEGRNIAEATAGGVTVRVTAEPRVNSDYTEIVPILDVIVDGQTVVRAEGISAGGDWRQGMAEIVEMDGSNATPEVVFSSYSGGAHCCTHVIVAAADGDGRWSAKAVGDWDGGGDYIEDADGDGTAELVVIDNAFLYAFDCYACSAAPLKILAVSRGAVRDVTREPRFREKHRTWLKAMEAWGSDRRGEFAPGYYAGWVAQKSILGEGREAWVAMTAAHKGTPDPGHEICKDGKPLEDCKTEDQITVPFPEALKVFLDTLGYHF